MKKKMRFIIAVTVCIAGYFLWMPVSSFKKEPVYIAVAGPLDNPRGQAMQKGVALCREMINKKGGIDGRRIEIMYFNDNDDPDTARSIASTIANDNKAIAVIGHYRNAPSIAAGKIYKQNEIPVITASATDDAVIADNEWYFRVVPDTAMEAVFVANYIAREMGVKETSIVFSDDEYGKSLYEHFQKPAKSLGMNIKNTWEWNLGSDASEQDVNALINSITDSEDPGALFLAAHAKESTKIIAALKDKQKTWPVIGSYAFARSFFIELEDYPKEKSDPGYYSNGIYFVTPYMADIGGVEADIFKKAFLKKYQEIPYETSACYYDAVLTAVEAIKKSGVHGRANIREDRRRIRAALEGFFSEDLAVQGVAGQIFFGDDGGIKRHFAVGIYQHQKDLPAYFQYLNTLRNESQNITEAVLQGEVILAEDISMEKVRMVFVGIDNIRINSLDASGMQCNLEFDMMFKYSGYFDDAAIEFTNAVRPVHLGKPIEEATKNGSNIVMRKYHVAGDFRMTADFMIYPFDRQTIPVRFRHSRYTNDKVMYVADRLSVSGNPLKASPGGWEIHDISFYQDVIKKETSLGDPDSFDHPYHIHYSRFNTEIVVERNAPVLVFMHFIALIVMLCLLLYIVRFVPPALIVRRILLSMGVLAVCTIIYLICQKQLPSPYMTIPDSCFLVIFILGVIAVFVSVLSYRKHLRPKKYGLYFKA